jgi:hypothetical protein
MSFGTLKNNFLINKIFKSPLLPVEFIVVAGGGGGGGRAGGGGGGGGYKENLINLQFNTLYPITIGAGGIGAPDNNVLSLNGTNGNNSIFANITSSGGGGGGGNLLNDGFNGGSGGGGGQKDGIAGKGGNGNTPSSIPRQGNNAGDGFEFTRFAGGGGGGSGAVGKNGLVVSGGYGGDGAMSFINGTETFYAGGGGGGIFNSGGATGIGGLGGGGNGANFTGNKADSGIVNTGGGGGGGARADAPNAGGGNGGSGIIIIKISNKITATFSSGVTSALDNTSVLGFNIYTVTATSTTSETVTFS